MTPPYFKPIKPLGDVSSPEDSQCKLYGPGNLVVVKLKWRRRGNLLSVGNSISRTPSPNLQYSSGRDSSASKDQTWCLPNIMLDTGEKLLNSDEMDSRGRKQLEIECTKYAHEVEKLKDTEGARFFHGYVKYIVELTKRAKKLESNDPAPIELVVIKHFIEECQKCLRLNQQRQKFIKEFRTKSYQDLQRLETKDRIIKQFKEQEEAKRKQDKLPEFPPNTDFEKLMLNSVAGFLFFVSKLYHDKNSGDDRFVLFDSCMLWLKESSENCEYLLVNENETYPLHLEEASTDEDVQRFSSERTLNGDTEILLFTRFKPPSKEGGYKRNIEAVLAVRVSTYRKMIEQEIKKLVGCAQAQSTEYILVKTASGEFVTTCSKHSGDCLDNLGKNGLDRNYLIGAQATEIGKAFLFGDTDAGGWNYFVVDGQLMRIDYGNCFEQELCNDELGSTHWKDVVDEKVEGKRERRNAYEFPLTDDIAAQFGRYFSNVGDQSLLQISGLSDEEKKKFLKLIFATLIIGSNTVKEEAGREKEPDEREVLGTTEMGAAMAAKIDDVACRRAQKIEEFMYSPARVFDAVSKKRLSPEIGCLREAAVEAYHDLAVENKDPILTQAYLGWLIEQITAKVKAIPSKTCDAIALQKGGQGSTNGGAHFFQNGYLRTDHKPSTIAALNKIISGEVSDICGKIDKFFGGTPIPGDIKKYLVKIEQVIKGTSSCEVPEELREQTRP